jgi:hypothetical protein
MLDLALACACAGGQDKLSSVLKLVGVFMLVPFLAAAVVVLVLRRGARTTHV